MFYFVAFLMTMAVTAFVAAPLFRERRAWVNLPAPARRAMLMDERDMLLRELKDLEFDRRMGKIDDADYAELRSATSQKASVVLDALDSGHSAKGDALLEREIETEILVARARLQLRMKQESATVWQCECGREMSESDKFCASCGASRVQSA